MAKKSSKKSQAAKKPARRFRATPDSLSDRQHLIQVIQAETGCTGNDDRAARHDHRLAEEE